MTDIAFASARKLAGMIRRKKIGCLELLEHYLKRVEKYNPRLNAIIVRDFDAARKRAREADRALARGKVWGPLHGVPMTIKESYDVTGHPTTWGVPEQKNNIARRNALAVDRFLAAGVTLFGKTNVPYQLADGQAFNAIYGVTNNPWDLTRTPGGSSGGGAAALAAGLTGIEAGSDIASSLRNPPHYSGVFGHKPTWGICPPRGHSLGERMAPADISVIGPMARSAGDLDLALQVMAGPDEIDSRGYQLRLAAPKKKRLRDFKVAVLLDDRNAEVDNEVKDGIQGVADFLAKKKAKVNGNAFPEIDTDRAATVWRLLVHAALSARQTDTQFAEKLGAVATIQPDDRSAMAQLLRGQTMRHRDWLTLNEERHKMRWKWHEFFQEYDVLICPPLSTAAMKHAHDKGSAGRTIMVNGRPQPYDNQLFWAGLFGMTYLPGTVAPAGLTKTGLPTGVQIVGPQYGDLTTIHFAKLLEQEFRGFVPPPGYD